MLSYGDLHMYLDTLLRSNPEMFNFLIYPIKTRNMIIYSFMSKKQSSPFKSWIVPGVHGQVVSRNEILVSVDLSQLISMLVSYSFFLFIT